MAERKELGQGFEHDVVQALHHPTKVLKTPRPHNLFLMRLFGQDPQFIKKELALSQDKVKGTSILIPPTRLFSFKNSYVIVQSKITEDNSISNICEYLKTHGNTFLRYKHLHNPTNFICQENRLYWIDPSYGPGFFRIINMINPQVAEKYYIIQTYFKSKFRNITSKAFLA